MKQFMTLAALFISVPALAQPGFLAEILARNPLIARTVFFESETGRVLAERLLQRSLTKWDGEELGAIREAIWTRENLRIHRELDQRLFETLNEADLISTQGLREPETFADQLLLMHVADTNLRSQKLNGVVSLYRSSLVGMSSYRSSVELFGTEASSMALSRQVTEGLERVADLSYSLQRLSRANLNQATPAAEVTQLAEAYLQRIRRAREALIPLAKIGAGGSVLTTAEHVAIRQLLARARANLRVWGLAEGAGSIPETLVRELNRQVIQLNEELTLRIASLQRVRDLGLSFL